MEIKSVLFGDSLRESVIECADNCSWGAGPFLAKQMKDNEFSDWERVFAAVDDGSIAGYCTLAKSDCIPDMTYTPYIGFVFVGEQYRGKRLSELMIKCALRYAKEIGFNEVFVVSGEQGLYEKYGFKKIDEKCDFWGKAEQIFKIKV